MQGLILPRAPTPVFSSGQEDVERNVLIPRVEEYVAYGDLQRPATGTNAIDLGNGKNRKGLCAGIERAG